MPEFNVDRWAVTPRREAEPAVILEVADLFEFRLTPLQAVQLASALATAAKALDAMRS